MSLKERKREIQNGERFGCRGGFIFAFGKNECFMSMKKRMTGDLCALCTKEMMWCAFVVSFGPERYLHFEYFDSCPHCLTHSIKYFLPVFRDTKMHGHSSLLSCSLSPSLYRGYLQK